MRALFSLLFLAVAMGSAGQGGLSNYYDPTDYKLIDITDHLDPKFSFSIKGKIQTSMNEGYNEYLEGNYYRAVKNLNEVIKHDSTYWPAFYYRGLCYKNSFKLDSAIADLQKALDRNGSLFEAMIELGEIYHVTKKLGKAKDLYQRASDINPQSPIPYLLLGHVFLYRLEINRAVRQYEKCNEIDAKFPDSYFVQGLIISYKEPKSAKVSAMMTRAIEADSTYMPALFMRGFLAANANQSEKALADFDRILKAKPGNTFVLLMRAYLYIELGRPDDAFSDIRKVVMSRDMDESKYTGGQTKLDKMVDLQNTVKYLTMKGYGLDEKCFTELKRATCYLLSEKRDDALKALNTAQKIQLSSCGYLMKALAFEGLRQYDSSLANYNKALLMDNDIFDAHKKRAIYRYEANNWKGAYEDLNQMRRINPSSPATLRLSGMIKSNLKDYYGCIIDMAAYVKNDTSDLESWQVKAYCHMQVKDYKNAIADYTRCIELRPKSRDLYSMVYLNQLAIRDSVGSIRTLRTMERNWPNDRQVVLEFAGFQLRKKSYDSALSIVSRAFDTFGNLTVPHLGDMTGKNASAMISQKITALTIYRDSYAGANKLKEALGCANELMKLDPSNSERRFEKTKLLIRMNRTKEAKNELALLRAANYAAAEVLCKRYLDN